MANDQVAGLTPQENSDSQDLANVLDSSKSKINQLESKIAEFEKGKRSFHFFNERLFNFGHLNCARFPDIVLYQQLRNESQSLDKWMIDVQNFLTAEEVGWGDIDIIEAQLEQSNVIRNSIRFERFQ